MEMKMVVLWVMFGLMMMKNVNAITCGEAIATLSSCNSYLAGNDPAPSPTCCLAVQKVNQQATTPQIRKNLCVCFEEVAPKVGVKTDKAKNLPNLCHVKVPVPIDPTIDCNTYVY
ncbi:Non-specific lipid-transfer protein 1 [Euphorbia peplus]|nr:Non-specific lipid-transfer protein 1 [Euphorbia peplus]